MNQISLHTLACEGRLTHGLKNSSNPLLLLGKIICWNNFTQIIIPVLHGIFFAFTKTIIAQGFSRELTLPLFQF